MKIRFSIFVTVICGSLLAQSNLFDLESVGDEAQELLAARRGSTPKQEFDLKQLGELHRAIVGNRPNVWAMPSPMLEVIQKELEPLRSIAKQLAESERSGERYYGAVLNSYLAPTPESRSLLIELAHDERPETAATALDTLFGLKLETPELRSELVRALQEDAPPRMRSTMHSLARSNAGKWKLAEAVPSLIAIAEKTYQTEKRVDSVVKQLNLLGPDAQAALPVLKTLLEKRKADGDANFRETEALEHAILVISGQYRAPDQGTLVHSSSDTSSSPQIPPLTQEQAGAKVQFQKTDDDDEGDYGWVSIFVGVMLSVVVGAAAWLLVKRR